MFDRVPPQRDTCAAVLEDFCDASQVWRQGLGQFWCTFQRVGSERKILVFYLIVVVFYLVIVVVVVLPSSSSSSTACYVGNETRATLPLRSRCDDETISLAPVPAPIYLFDMLQLGTHRDVPVGPRAARRLWKVGPLDPVQFEPILDAMASRP